MIIFTPNTVIKSADVNLNFAELTDIKSAWQSYTPSWTNLTVGSGANTGKYIQIGKTVHCRISFTFGSGSSMGTNPYFSLPVAMNSEYAGSGSTQVFGVAGIADYLTDDYEGILVAYDDNNMYVRIWNFTGTYPNAGSITNTVPITWTTNDRITANFTYESA